MTAEGVRVNVTPSHPGGFSRAEVGGELRVAGRRRSPRRLAGGGRS